MFRIPRQSSWLTDGRKINRYITPLEIPITSHPGEQNSEITWTFHHSLSDYSKYAHEAGFTIDLIEEWVTDRNVEKVQKNFLCLWLSYYLVALRRQKSAPIFQKSQNQFEWGF